MRACEFPFLNCPPFLFVFFPFLFPLSFFPFLFSFRALGPCVPVSNHYTWPLQVLFWSFWPHQVLFSSSGVLATSGTGNSLCVQEQSVCRGRSSALRGAYEMSRASEFPFLKCAFLPFVSSSPPFPLSFFLLLFLSPWRVCVKPLHVATSSVVLNFHIKLKW